MRGINHLLANDFQEEDRVSVCWSFVFMACVTTSASRSKLSLKPGSNNCPGIGESNPRLTRRNSGAFKYSSNDFTW